MEWKCSDFEHLSTHELYLILRARSTVFVVEHARIHLDIDDKDETALHVFFVEQDQSSPQIGAYARLLPGDEFDPEVVIDKVLTGPARRDDDTHSLLLTHALAAAWTAWPGHAIHISVPTHEEKVYETFGFRKAVGPFLEHGIPYLGMAWNATEQSRTLPAKEVMDHAKQATYQKEKLFARLPHNFGAMP